MDPDLLRLLLVVLGVLLVVGIYLWDRYKRAIPPARNRRVLAQRDEPASFGDAPSAKESPDRDGALWRNESSETRQSASFGDIDTTAEHVKQGARQDMDPEPRNIGEWAASDHRTEPQLSMGLHFDAHGDNDYLNADPALEQEVERKLVVIHLAARGGVFIGPGIEKACAGANLSKGEMGIFHRQDAATGKVSFSLASMVEPGNFPFDDMAHFKTPGLSIFTQLPGARDGVEIYTEMLTAARELARLLNAEIQDERHNKLTQQMQDHMRDSIIEHRTRVRLARSRH